MSKKESEKSKTTKKVSRDKMTQTTLKQIFRAGFMGGLLYGANNYDPNDPQVSIAEAMKSCEEMFGLIDLDGTGELMTEEQAKNAIAKAARISRKK